jgi:hypothetical protein
MTGIKKRRRTVQHANRLKSKFVRRKLNRLNKKEINWRINEILENS